MNTPTLKRSRSQSRPSPREDLASRGIAASSGRQRPRATARRPHIATRPEEPAFIDCDPVVPGIHVTYIEWV